MNDPRLAQMCGAEDADASKRLAIKCWSSIFHRIASHCLRPVAQIAERNRHAAPVLLVDGSVTPWS